MISVLCVISFSLIPKCESFIQDNRWARMLIMKSRGIVDRVCESTQQLGGFHKLSSSRRATYSAYSVRCCHSNFYPQYPRGYSSNFLKFEKVYSWHFAQNQRRLFEVNALCGLQYKNRLIYAQFITIKSTAYAIDSCRR